MQLRMMVATAIVAKAAASLHHRRGVVVWFLDLGAAERMLLSDLNEDVVLIIIVAVHSF